MVQRNSWVLLFSIVEVGHSVRRLLRMFPEDALRSRTGTAVRTFYLTLASKGRRSHIYGSTEVTQSR